MLFIDIPGNEYWDSDKQEFIYIDKKTIQLEHSLVSISKWESKYNKVFLSKDDKSVDEILYYIKCMTITQNVNPIIYLALTEDNFSEVNAYIDAPMSATYFSKDNNKSLSREPITSELIYYWMISFNIPFECQKWHLNRLLTLIKICAIKNQQPNKMGKKELLSRNAKLNEMRKKQLNTKG